MIAAVDTVVSDTVTARDLVVAPLAAAGFHVIVIDPLGTGWSSYPAKAEYPLTAQCDRIALAMELPGVRSAVVVSSALASSITLRVAYRHPDLVAALVSIDGGPAETASTPGLRRAMRFAPLLKLFVGAGTIRGSCAGPWPGHDRDLSRQHLGYRRRRERLCGRRRPKCSRRDRRDARDQRPGAVVAAVKAITRR